MTIKELKEKLDQFSESYIVLVPNENLYRDSQPKRCVAAENVVRGVNEMDGVVIINDYVEDD